MLKSFFLLFSFLLALSLSSQSQDLLASLNDTATVNHAEVTSTAAPVMKKSWNHFEGKNFSLNFGVAFILDHNIAVQDDNNITQVGKVNAATEFRGERFIVTGNLKFFKYPWRYMVSANFNGLDAPQGSKKFSFIDYNIEIPLGKTAGWLTLGKQKEGVGHEYVLPGTQAMFMERGSGAPMLVRQRNIGIRYSNSLKNNRMTFTFGLFNDFLESGLSFSDNGSQITSRLTLLPQYKTDADLLHFGVGYRYSDAKQGKLSYKAKPESNTAPSYINTGSFNAQASNTFMLEAIKVNGPVSLIAEYMVVSVHVPEKNPSFHYFHVGGSWFITGENRRYNKNTGNLGKLIPKKNFKFRKGSGSGAFEVGARYTYLDANDQAIEGGQFGRLTGAVSWYPNAHFRFSVNYGHGKLDKNDIKGKVGFWQFRAQFEL
jgi:phosphate-selective porin OprO and OprP